MHASALFGRPVISLWGATHPSLGFTPWPAQPQERMIITKSLWSPASKHGQRPFWMPNPMKKLPLEKILVLTAQILQDKTKP
jgi:ADP-heptose:LPS heptosyltransferase